MALTDWSYSGLLKLDFVGYKHH